MAQLNSVGKPDPKKFLPGYEILGELGRGGMGVVYRARSVALGRPVALKMIRGGDRAGPAAVARFRAEAQTVARLRHPNIVPVHEVGEAHGQPYFALELVEGGTLADRVRRAPLPARAAARLVETLARAMHHVHGLGIVHRDLKPQNVLVTAEGTPLIIDFGLARGPDAEAGPTPGGVILGTPGYMAPEQATGRPRDVGPAADVYALGAILYELVTDRPPFRAETPLDTVLLALTEEPVPPRFLRPRLPRDLETICLKCLEKDPTRRYASARELADDLRRFLDDELITARRAGLVERLGKWARRGPGRAAVVAAAALLLVLLRSGLEGTLVSNATLVGLPCVEKATPVTKRQGVVTRSVGGTCLPARPGPPKCDDIQAPKKALCVQRRGMSPVGARQADRIGLPRQGGQLARVAGTESEARIWFQRFASGRPTALESRIRFLPPAALLVASASRPVAAAAGFF